MSKRDLPGVGVGLLMEVVTILLFVVAIANAAAMCVEIHGGKYYLLPIHGLAVVLALIMWVRGMDA